MKRGILTSCVLLVTVIVVQVHSSLEGQSTGSPIRFDLKSLPFRLYSDESQSRNVPETMAGGVAVFDYDGDGRPDIFFANGADLATMQKTGEKQWNRLFHNNGDGTFSDVTENAGLAGTGFAVGIAVGDYDNDGHPDLFVAGVRGNALYHNNGDGKFTDVTKKAGLDKWNDPEFGPLWAVAAAWVDVNNDGHLDLFVLNYLHWTYDKKPLCKIDETPDYCHPRYYKGLPDQLFLNQGDGTFRDVSKQWGIRDHIGKGMGVGVADFDLDGRPDLFVTNDGGYEFFFHNLGDRFEEISFQTNTALPEEGAFISGMGVDFRDLNNDGFPDISYVALNRETFPVLLNTGHGDFREVTASSGIGKNSLGMAGFGPALYDFDNDGWKDLFVSRGHVSATRPPNAAVNQPNTVFRNLGPSGQWQPLTEEAGFTAATAARHRGCALGDFDGDGRVDLLAGNYWFKYLGDGKFKPVKVGTIGGRIAAAHLINGSRAAQVVIAPGDGVGPLRWYECKADPENTADWVGHDLLGRDMVHGHSLAIADVDGDGNLDLFAAEMSKWTERKATPDNPDAEALIFFGDANGNFRKTVFAKGIGFHEARVADLNGDGRMDVLDKPYNWDAPRVDVWLQEPAGK